MGYSYGFQLLGGLYWKQKSSGTVDMDRLLQEYSADLQIKSYEKIYSGLSGNERKVLIAVSRIPYCDEQPVKIEEIRNLLPEMSKQLLNSIKNQLLRRQIIKSSQRGQIELTLPLFGKAVAEMKDFL